MKTYAEFQEYYTRRMWRVGDAEWAIDLPTLMSTAEQQIKTDLRHVDLLKTATLTAVSEITELPADCRELMSVSIQDCAPALAVSPTMYTDASSTYLMGGVAAGETFCQKGRNLHFLTSATADSPIDVDITYYAGIVNYADATEGVDSFYDIYPSFYEAAVDVRAYTYLKDFALAATFEAKYTQLLEGMRSENEYKRYPSGQISNVLPGNVM